MDNPIRELNALRHAIGEMEGYLYPRLGSYWLGDCPTTGTDAAPRRTAYNSVIHSPLDTAQMLAVKLVHGCFSVTGRHVLDLGCGRAGFLSALWRMSPFERPALGAGVDCDEWAVVHTWLPAGCPWRTLLLAGDLQNEKTWGHLQEMSAALKLPYGWDLIVGFEVFEHMAAPQHAVMHLWRVAAPGAIVFCTIPGNQDREADEHPSIHPPEYWVELFERGGFRFLPGMTKAVSEYGRAPSSPTEAAPRPICSRMSWRPFVFIRDLAFGVPVGFDSHPLNSQRRIVQP